MQASSLFWDYARFHRIQIQNRDVDPVYPVLRRVGDLRGWTDEERVRSVFLHVAYYDFGSALAAVDRQYGAFLGAFTQPRPGLKCGTERRRHRMGNNLAEHLSDLHHIAGEYNGLSQWVRTYVTESPVDSWAAMTNALMDVNGNGRWAAFKTCEMLAEVCGLPLEAPDMGHANSSGPRAGLGLLYTRARNLEKRGNRAEVIEELNLMSEHLVGLLRGQGLEATLATAETTLCDFHSLCEGRYYPGLDIDVMQEQLHRAGLSTDMLTAAVRARRETLPVTYLGEIEGWMGPDRARKRIYRATGEIVERE
jgi:hypothetical protein